MLNLTINRIDKNFRNNVARDEFRENPPNYPRELDSELFKIFDEKMQSYLIEGRLPYERKPITLYQELKELYFTAKRPMSFFRVLKFLNRPEEKKILSIFKGMLYDLAGEREKDDYIWKEINLLLEYF